MALNSKILMKKANRLPKLKLAPKNERNVATPNGKHEVIFIADQVISLMHPKRNRLEPFVRYIFQEGGTNKSYDRPVKDDEGQLHYFIEQMSVIEEGETVILEARRQGAKMYISLDKTDKPKIQVEFKKLSEVEEAEIEDDEDEEDKQ